VKRPVVERRKLARRPVLEDMVQDAIDAVRSERIVEAVDDAVGIIKGLPDDLQHRALHALRNRAGALLGIKTSRPAAALQGKPRANPDAEALFAKPEAA
jgi:hypothetical protein